MCPGVLTISIPETFISDRGFNSFTFLAWVIVDASFGMNGIMRYRGYDINDLAEKSSFEKVSYLMLYGKFPDDSELKDFKKRIIPFWPSIYVSSVYVCYH